MIIMQIACDAVTKICSSPTVAVCLVSIPDTRARGWRVWGAGQSSMSLQCKTDARARSLTHSHTRTADTERKIVGKQRTSCEMRCRTNHIFYLGDWREGDGESGVTGIQDFTVNFVIPHFMHGVAIRSSDGSSSSSTMTTLTSLYFACGIHSTRFTDIRYSTFAVVFFSHCERSLQWNKWLCVWNVLHRRKDKFYERMAHPATGWAMLSANIRNNAILLKFAIGHDKHRPFHPVGAEQVAARKWCVNHVNAVALIHRNKSNHPPTVSCVYTFYARQTY